MRAGSDKHFHQKLQKLRGQAEARLTIVPSIIPTPETKKHLQHELQVHQIELEMQNEELRQVQTRLEETRDRYVDLYVFAPVGYLSVNNMGMISETNLKAASMLGSVRNRLINRRLALFVDDEDKSRWQHQFLSLRDAGSGEVLSFDLKFTQEDGSSFIANLSCIRMDSTFKQEMVRITLLDISARKLAEDKLRISDDRHRSILATAMDGFWRTDMQGHFLEVNETYCQMSGYSEQELLSMQISDIEAIESVQNTADHLRKVIVQGEDRFESKHYRKDGSVFDVEISVQFQATEGGQFVVFVRDITQRNLAELNSRIATTAFESQEAILVTDANKVIVRVNDAFTKITGYSAEEAIGQTPRLLSSGHHSPEFYEIMWASINGTGSWEGEVWNRRKNGEVYPHYLTVSSVKDASGVVMNYVATSTDISLSKAAAKEIHQLVFFDPLTGVPNRRLLLDRLTNTLVNCARKRSRGAILFIDLDHFKTLNDTLGHDIGDMLLQQVAERLKSCVREGDTVSRLGGDEFVVLLEDLSEHDLEAAAQAEGIANKILIMLNQPYSLNEARYQSSASIGVALFSHKDKSKEELLKHADIAMYQAKQAGRNTLRFFDPVMQDAINVRADMERDLRVALTNKEFQLYYQVQVDHLGQPFGAEALIRWIHPEHGLISPFHFIPLAEETGLILPIGLWVLETACAQLKAWEQHESTRKLTISVNVSAKQLHQADFVMQVQTTVRSYAINPSLLKLELTESMLADHIEKIIIAMIALQAIGVRFELDDFGTGYSSLQYLKRLPLYQLKIDQSFVRELATDPSDKAIVRTVIAMAQSLNLEVIAEGVETEEQRQLLLDKGCRHFQGYLFGRPLPITEFETLLGES